MLPTIAALRARLEAVLTDKTEQGHDVAGLAKDLAAAGDSYDALATIGRRLAEAPLRADWPYEEPDDLEGILAAADPARPRDPLAVLAPEDARARAEAAFLGRVCGCMLGKPFEIDPTFDELRDALEPIGEWPLRDYLSEAGLGRLRERQGQWPELVRERIDHVVPDDDINYTIVGMLLLEAAGVSWTKDQLLEQWGYQLPQRATFGPERTLMARAALQALQETEAPDIEAWVSEMNPGAELCGALIRVDAYAYACLGDPARAAALAWRDASCTHRRTGVYAAMFIAAAIAAAPCAEARLDPFRIALGFVPQRSRFAERARRCLDEVTRATSFDDGYRRVHDAFGDFSHCRVYQEIGTLMNTLRFADDAGHGICLQVMQGNDTDSFGATAGSLLGAMLGPDALEERWWQPFDDDLRTALALFHERSLAAVTRRMGALPLLAG